MGEHAYDRSDGAHVRLALQLQRAHIAALLVLAQPALSPPPPPSAPLRPPPSPPPLRLLSLQPPTSSSSTPLFPQPLPPDPLPQPLSPALSASSPTHQYLHTGPSVEGHLTTIPLVCKQFLPPVTHHFSPLSHWLLDSSTSEPANEARD